MSPFDQSAHGFNQEWWDIPVSAYRDADHDWFVLRLDGEEAARVEVNTARLIRVEDYREWPRNQSVAEITFLEVRADLTRRGIGTALVRKLAHRYETRILAAHPKNSDGFWESLGWERYDKIQDRPSAPPLYAAVSASKTAGRVGQE